ncbi:MAG TPA: amidohydrolase family protein [Rectinemataceae bacterium]
MEHSFILAPGGLMLAESAVEGGWVRIRDGRVMSFGEDDPERVAFSDAEASSLPIYRFPESILAPGLTEFHIHGAFGLGFEAVESGEQLVRLARDLRARGVVRFIPTILWDEKAVRNLVRAIDESGLPPCTIPGIHIEGPFVNPAKRGGIGESNIHDPDPGLLERIIEIARGRLRIMTLAPELPGADALYPILRRAGILISLGHSAADASSRLPDAPFSITHLFNAMSGLDHRLGGLAGRALCGEAAWVELNADGVHVNAQGMRVAWRCIGSESLILTSDAIAPAGRAEGPCSYFGAPAVSGPDGVRYSGSGTLIGSNRLGSQIVLSFASATEAPLAQAWKAMSANPVRALGLDPARAGGTIAPGATADLFLWERGFGSCEAIADALRRIR